MTYRERIKVLRNLRELSDEKEKEALNWAIKVCEKFTSKKEAQKREW